MMMLNHTSGRLRTGIANGFQHLLPNRNPARQVKRHITVVTEERIVIAQEKSANCVDKLLAGGSYEEVAFTTTREKLLLNQNPPRFDHYVEDVLELICCQTRISGQGLVAISDVLADLVVRLDLLQDFFNIQGDLPFRHFPRPKRPEIAIKDTLRQLNFKTKN